LAAIPEYEWRDISWRRAVERAATVENARSGQKVSAE
jgi:hypothetical protein